MPSAHSLPLMQSAASAFARCVDTIVAAARRPANRLSFKACLRERAERREASCARMVTTGFDLEKVRMPRRGCTLGQSLKRAIALARPPSADERAALSGCSRHRDYEDEIGRAVTSLKFLRKVLRRSSKKTGRGVARPVQVAWERMAT